ncbi:MAG: DUF4347 domain-containing protein, partial [Deltaproteobacteria bacterium]|nr:DUF4347 domain-containing protein [Deltaproteobacteria bacterium]
MLEHIFKLESRIMLNAASPVTDVMVISDLIDDHSDLADAVNEHVLKVNYDHNTDNLDSILDKIEGALDGKQADKIGFATHGESGSFDLTAEETVTRESIETDPEQIAFFTELSALVVEDGRIDILACDVWNNDAGQYVEQSLEVLTGIDFAFSDDITGKDGNWILESDNIDLTDPTAGYFDDIALENFDGDLEKDTIEISANGGKDIMTIVDADSKDEAIQVYITDSITFHSGVGSNERISFSGSLPDTGSLTMLATLPLLDQIDPTFVLEVGTHFPYVPDSTSEGYLSFNPIGNEGSDITQDNNQLILSKGGSSIDSINNLIEGTTYTPGYTPGDYAVYIAFDTDTNITHPKDLTYLIFVKVLNRPPEAQDVTKNIDVDNRVHTFTKEGLGYSDPDKTALEAISENSSPQDLNKIQITSLPGDGVFKLGTDEVTLNQVIAIADINAGNLKFEADANEYGANYASFDFKVYDGYDWSENSATATIDVSNDAPTSEHKNIEIDIDKTHDFDGTEFAFNDTNTTHTAINQAEITGISGEGTFTYSGGTLTDGTTLNAANLNSIVYTQSSAHPLGDDIATLTFQLSDGAGLFSGEYNITIDVINNPPTSDDFDTSIAIDKTYNFDNDPEEFTFNDPDTTIHTAVNQVDIINITQNGVFKYDHDNNSNTEDIALTTGIIDAALLDTIKYTPSAQHAGDNDAQLTFKVSDDAGLFSVDTYNITIDVENVAPTSENKTIDDVEIDETYNFTGTEFAFSDANDNHNAINQIDIINITQNGDFKYDHDDNTGTDDITLTAGIIDASLLDTIKYTPSAQHAGDNDAQLTFKVSDDAGLFSVDANTITINVDNEQPESENKTVTVLPGGTYTFSNADFTFTDTDTVHNAVQNIKITSSNDLGELSYDTGAGIKTNQDIITANIEMTIADLKNLKYTPSGEDTGSFTFQVSDEAGLYSENFTITIEVKNNPPESDNETVSTQIDAPYVFKNADFYFEDLDEPHKTLNNIKIISLAPTNEGTLEYDSGAPFLNQEISASDISKLIYTPDKQHAGNGVATFTFKVSDDFNLYSDAPYTITINVDNIAPTSTDETVTTAIQTPHAFAGTEFTFDDPNKPIHNAINQINITGITGNGDFEYDHDNDSDTDNITLTAGIIDAAILNT